MGLPFLQAGPPLGWTLKEAKSRPQGHPESLPACGLPLAASLENASHPVTGVPSPYGKMRPARLLTVGFYPAVDGACGTFPPYP